MLRRPLAILHSTANRESARTDLALTRVFFLLLAFLVLTPASPLSRVFGPIGAHMLRVQLAPSVILVLFLAVRLGGDSVGDVRCGLLELLFLTDTKPRQWLLVRVAQMWIAFASVWIFRAPLLFFIYTLGGVRAESFLVSELLLLTGFLFLSSLSLLFSFQARSRQQVFGYVFGAVFLWEFLLMAPGIVAGVLSRFYNWRVTLDVTAATTRIEGLGLVAGYRSAVDRPLIDCCPTFALYGGLSVLVLVWFHRRLAGHASGTAAPARATETVPEPGRQRASRRCWDDALAWQSFTIHGGGRSLVLGKCVGYVLLGALMCFLAARGFAEAAFVITVATAAGMLLMSMNKAGDCLSREIREQTITMLLLTPNGPDDYYAGWQRGAWRLAWPDVLLGAGVTAAAAAFSPGVPPILIAVGAGLMSSGPFLMLSPLVPFSVAGVATGLLLIVALMVMLIVVILFSVSISSAAVPLMAIPVVVIYNQALRRLLLPYWMEQKISTVV